MADAEMAASLLMRLEEELARRFRVGAFTHAMLREIQRASAREIGGCVARFATGANV